MRATAADLQESFRVVRDDSGELRLDADPKLLRVAAAGGALLRVVDRNNTLLGPPGATFDLGPPAEGGRDVGD